MANATTDFDTTFDSTEEDALGAGAPSFADKELYEEAERILGKNSGASKAETTDFMGKVRQVGNRMLSSMGDVYSNPYINDVVRMQGKALETVALVTTADKLVTFAWARMDDLTKDCDNKAIKYALRTEVGKAVVTVLLCGMVTKLFMLFEKSLRAGGHNHKAMACQKICSLLAYISARQLTKAMSFDKLIDILLGGMERFMDSAGVSLDDIDLPNLGSEDEVVVPESKGK